MKYCPIILALAAANILTVYAQSLGVGNQVAAGACKGFPEGVTICLTSVSYAYCSGKDNVVSNEIFVPDGYRCEQGIVGKQVDGIWGMAPTTTRTFDLHTYGATSAPTVAA
ncbi:hypothetical protein OHC33_008405 [Knufia fluminis]|uniref:Uncharacterized protein n=1 Tax=Knufia fluminis TaxID=191047 RepID=A0AAN8I216_9EURO|nr:hypothetical protein OHC33_008405 [Knufia fluminis]